MRRSGSAGPCHSASAHVLANGAEAIRCIVQLRISCTLPDSCCLFLLVWRRVWLVDTMAWVFHVTAHKQSRSVTCDALKLHPPWHAGPARASAQCGPDWHDRHARCAAARPTLGLPEDLGQGWGCHNIVLWHCLGWSWIRSAPPKRPWPSCQVGRPTVCMHALPTILFHGASNVRCLHNHLP